ncbi:acetate--CoA ligase [Barrientosiimonas marina]|uniref:Acetyl-coenzyme A synthetase n=1 Tax=Lentibacillus kimchii TaxID=1542911 RepID=A0ABW2UQ83_9BACI
MSNTDRLNTLLEEDRTFEPPESFKAQANFNDPSVYERAANDPEGYWAEQAEYLSWFKPYSEVLNWNPPHAEWFVDGKLNAAYNCVDRHREGPNKNKAAIIWEGEQGNSQIFTYDMLGREVDKAAHMLKQLGVNKGDRVAIYLPMIPELPISMLACAKIGAIHSVVFAAYSAKALNDRITDTEAKLLITSDGSRRSGKILPLKDNADKAVKDTTVETTLVINNIGPDANTAWNKALDVDWGTLKQKMPTTPLEHEEMDAEDPLFILYTSGTTGKPKGIVHTTGGYLTGVNHSVRSIFDLKDEDVFWCTADIGWVTGHSYSVYGPLSAGGTSVMYEGGPAYPERDRFWDIVEKYGVTIFYTAPTSIRTFMKWGHEYVEKHDLSSLRLLGTVGEPINPEAWMWYHKYVGGEKCPIVDTWWQTENGSAMIAPLPGITTTKPGSATKPAPGIIADIFDGEGNPVEPGNGGYLVIKQPWPSMLRTVWGDDQRFKDSYFGDYDGIYTSGDVAHKDKDGYIWILGRDDDVINVSGHRLGASELESAIVSHDAVAEAAVIGRSDDIKGEAITAFVTLKERAQSSDELHDEIVAQIVDQIGKIARPDEVIFTASLPKTSSAKIMRRLLRDIAEGKAVGDTSTLEDPSVVEDLKEKYAEAEEQ